MPLSSTKSTAKRRAAERLEITRAVGYTRVSTEEQAESGLSLESQKAKIEGYCVAKDWQIVEIFTDAGLSAKDLKRPALHRALAALEPGVVLVCLKLDRLTRSVTDLQVVIDAVEEKGAEWCSISEHFDTTTATGRLMLGLVAQLSQWEREVIAERVADALAQKKVRRERLGATPLGYATVQTEQGPRAVIDESEQETVALIRRLHGQGLSLRKIAQQLTEDGHATKRGGKWHARTVKCYLETRYLETLGIK